MKEKYNNADIISSFSAARSSYTDLIASKDGNDLEVSSGNSKENETMDGNPQTVKGELFNNEAKSDNFFPTKSSSQSH